ncbi:MAG: hypothetical protein U0414_17420 [Polyangiaceae bacterium]
MTKPSPKKPAHARKKSDEAPRVSKTDFVLSLPEHTPAAEVVARAKEAGLVMREKYVYNVRAAHRARSGERPAPRSVAQGRAPRTRSELEARFIDLALDIGFARAEELFAEIRAMLKAGVARG